MTHRPPEIRPVDPQGADAIALLAEAAVEASALYPELHDPTAPGPTNAPTPPRGIDLVAYLDGTAVACGALRPLDDDTAEVRRMYVRRSHRRLGLASAILHALEQAAADFGYRTLRLETGYRQQPAIALYEVRGFAHIAPFGPYVDDPTSVCFEKQLVA